MKKIFVLFIVLAISQMMAAQSLIGTWRRYDASGSTVTYVFSQSNRMKLFMKGKGKDDAAGSFLISISFSGSYTKSGNNVLYLRLEKGSVNVDDLKFNSNLSQEERNQLTAAAYRTADLYSQATNSQLPRTDNMVIKSLTANELIFITHDRKRGEIQKSH